MFFFALLACGVIRIATLQQYLHAYMVPCNALVHCAIPARFSWITVHFATNSVLQA